eukprot:gene14397-3805_t
MLPNADNPQATIDYVVRASSATDVIPFGSYPVHVYRCGAAESWSSLGCVSPSAPGDSDADANFL